MIFEYPQFFYLLWSVPVFLLYNYFIAKKRRNAMAKVIYPHLAAMLTFSVDQRKRRMKKFILIFAFILLIIASAGPRWGEQVEEVPQKGVDIIVALDTSKSMLAEDVKPNRLERSKLAVLDLLKVLKGDRIGLIPFSGTSFLQVPLTLDYNAFTLSLQQLSAGIIPRGGTNIEEAIERAVEAFKKGGISHEKILIIISDGENHEGDPIKAAKAAASEGIRIISIGIGSTEGELVPVRDENGELSYLRDADGNLVKSRLDEETLKRIAEATGGVYQHLSHSLFALDALYNQTIGDMERSEFKSTMTRRYKASYQIPLFIALILFAFEFTLDDRSREGRLRT